MLKTISTILLFLISFQVNAAIIGGGEPDGRFAGYEDGLQIPESPFFNPHCSTNRIVQAENGVTPRAGSWMQRTYLNRLTMNCTYRAETKVLVPYTIYPNQQIQFVKGKEYWMGISLYFPEDWDMNYVNGYSNGIVWQFHDVGFADPNNCGANGTSPCWRHTLPLTLMHDAEGVILRNHTWLNGYNAGNYKGIKVVIPWENVLGRWVDFVVNVQFSGNISPDDNNGFIKVWMDGKVIYERVGQNYFGEQGPGQPYFQFGIYNWGWREQYRAQWTGPNERLLYHDELRVGDANSSYEEVSPPNSNLFKPNPPTNLK